MYMYVDDACALAVNFIVYLRKCEKTLFNGRIRIRLLLNTCKITYKTLYVYWHSKCSFRRVCIEMKSRNHNMNVEQRKFRAHGICVQTNGRRCEDVVKKALIVLRGVKTSSRSLQ